jgi:hypothetical protein
MNRQAVTVSLGPVALVLLCLTALVSPGGDGPRQKEPVVGKAGPKAKLDLTAKGRRLRALLNDSLDMTGYQAPMTLMESLKLIQKDLKDKYKEEDVFPVLVDAEAFKEENPDAPDIYDTQVKFPPFPQRMSVVNALRLALSKVPTNNAVHLIRRGVIEITTKLKASPAHLLEVMVEAQFNKRPLDEALDELSEQTGATIILDPRVGDKARAPVSAIFRNSATLEAAVGLLAEMADLQVNRGQSDVLFVTEKRKAGGAVRGGSLEIRNVPLDQALRELAEWSGKTIVLDPRAARPEGPAAEVGEGRAAAPAKSPFKTLVSATFQKGAQPQAAAKILAAMAGLSAVDVGNVVFVTAPELTMQFAQPFGVGLGGLGLGGLGVPGGVAPR